MERSPKESEESTLTPPQLFDGCSNYANQPFPPGINFSPTDQELIFLYLNKKVSGQPLYCGNFFHEVNVYTHHPAELFDKYKLDGRDEECYFFSPRERKYPNGHRPNRSVGQNHDDKQKQDKQKVTEADKTTTDDNANVIGFWKATGANINIKDGKKGNGNIIGTKRCLAFYEGTQNSGGNKTEWMMHEYVIKASRKVIDASGTSMMLDDWVTCKLYRKKARSKPNHGSSNTSPDSQSSVSLNRNGEVVDKHLEQQRLKSRVFMNTFDQPLNSHHPALVAPESLIPLYSHDPAPMTPEGLMPSYDPAPMAPEGSMPSYDPAPMAPEGSMPSYDPAPMAPESSISYVNHQAYGNFSMPLNNHQEQQLQLSNCEYLSNNLPRPIFSYNPTMLPQRNLSFWGNYQVRENPNRWYGDLPLNNIHPNNMVKGYENFAAPARIPSQNCCAKGYQNVASASPIQSQNPNNLFTGYEEVVPAPIPSQNPNNLATGYDGVVPAPIPSQNPKNLATGYTNVPSENPNTLDEGYGWDKGYENALASPPQWPYHLDGEDFRDICDENNTLNLDDDSSYEPSMLDSVV